MKKKPPKRLPAEEIAMYASYAEQFPHDEIGRWMGCRVKDGKFRMLAQRLDITKDLQRHHLVRVGRRRHLRSALIVLTKKTRHWAQQIQPREGLVACVLSKLRKRAALHEPEEFDIAEADFANGGKSIKAEIEAFIFTDERWACWQYECVKRLSEIQTVLGDREVQS